MKMRKCCLFAALLPAVAIVFASCTDFAQKLAMKGLDEAAEFEREDTAKWGPVVEQELQLLPFTAIDARGAVRVVFTQSDTRSVRVRGNEKCLAEYKFAVRKDELKVEPKNYKGRVNKNSPSITLLVSGPSLSDVEFSGVGRLEMPEPVVLHGSLDIEVEGAGEVCLADLTAQSLDVKMSGAGRCALGKVTTTEDIEIEVNGAGEITANVFCRDLDVEINGAGHAVLSGECRGAFSCSQDGASKVDCSALTVRDVSHRDS